VRVRIAERLAIALVAVSIPACKDSKVDARGRPVDVGRLRLHTFPAGAKVWIDGALKIDSTPATLVLREGKYRLRIQAPGAEALERDIEIEAGQVDELTINIPKPPEARIAVFSDVVGADVRINGYRRGATPLDPVVTKPGGVDITVTTPNGRAKSVRTELAIGEQKRIEVLFDRVASGPEESEPAHPKNESLPDPKGYLTLGLKPDGTVYTEEGEKIGDTPIVRKPMDPGEHALVLRSLDGRYEKHVTIDLEADQAGVFRFQFRDEDQVPFWKPTAKDAN
jgi:PEGA domain-containing protein